MALVEDLQQLLFEFRSISGDLESHNKEKEEILRTLKDTEENLAMEKTRNEELENELKKKDEVIDLINKQLEFIPKLMGDLEGKKAELRRSKKEKEHILEELEKQNMIAKMNDTSKTDLERKREIVKLTKQIKAQNEELEQLKEEIRKLKEDSERKIKEELLKKKPKLEQQESSRMPQVTREKKPSPQIQIQAPPPTPTPTPSRPREQVSAPAPSKKQEDPRSLDSPLKKVGFQLGSSEPSPKRAKVNKTSPASVRTTPRPRPAKPTDLVREDLNEDFWNKLAAEEAQRKRLYPHQVVQSPWQKGEASSATKFNFTRPANRGNEQRSTNTVKTNKRKLYSKTSQGPEEF